MARTNRENEILRILEKQYVIEVKNLARTLFVSEPTIRRTLIRMEENGLIIRAHGKVYANKVSAATNVALAVRDESMYKIKNDLAERASQLVHDGNVVMLDASTTAAHMVKYLEHIDNVVVITCSIKTSYMLSQTNLRFFCTGGECINKSFSLVGTSAIEEIKKFNADICFVSCHGLSSEGFATDTSITENDVRYQLMKQSKQKVLMIDDTKIDNGFYHNLCDISEFDTVICNKRLPESIGKKVKNFILVQ